MVLLLLWAQLNSQPPAANTGKLLNLQLNLNLPGTKKRFEKSVDNILRETYDAVTLSA